MNKHFLSSHRCAFCRLDLEFHLLGSCICVWKNIKNLDGIWFSIIISDIVLLLPSQDHLFQFFNLFFQRQHWQLTYLLKYFWVLWNLMKEIVGQPIIVMELLPSAEQLDIYKPKSLKYPGWNFVLGYCFTTTFKLLWNAPSLLFPINCMNTSRELRNFTISKHLCTPILFFPGKQVHLRYSSGFLSKAILWQTFYSQATSPCNANIFLLGPYAWC